jgi:glycosyltransferase involved in cell wall biosynthesis
MSTRILFPMRFRLMSRGGVTSYIQLLFGSLSDNIEVCDLTFRAGEKVHYGVASGGALYPVRRRCQVLCDALRYGSLVRGQRIDLVHLNPSLQPRAVRRDMWFARQTGRMGIPFIVFFHGWNRRYERQLAADAHRRGRFMRAFANAGKILVLAAEFKDRLVEWGMEANRIVVETMAIDDRLVEQHGRAETRLGDNDAPCRILFLSRIERAKGIYAALDALRLVRRKYPFVTMTIAGDGREGAQARRYARKQGIEGARFLGWVEGAAKRAAFTAADLYLFPTSWGEGMPVAVLEAMAYGLPVITCPVGGILDFFQDGRMGYLVDRPRPETLAGLCERLIRDPEARRRIGRFNREYAMQRFLASQMARRMEALYTEVIEAHPCRPRV